MALVVNLFYSKAIDIVRLFVRQLRQFLSSLPMHHESYQVTVQKIFVSGLELRGKLTAAASGKNVDALALVTSIMQQFKKMEPMFQHVAQKAPNYDFDVPMNGYRSFVGIAEKLAWKTLEMFQKPGVDIAKLRQLYDLHETLVQIFEHLLEILSHNPEGQLLTAEDLPLPELIKLTKEMRLSSFFGYFLGLQYGDWMAWQLKLVFGCVTREIFEENRAQKLVNMFWHADINRMRPIWNSSDSAFLWLFCKLMRPIAFSNEHEIYDPGSEKKICGRLISSIIRPGIMGGREPYSSSIVIHVHGGGFISGSARASEVYVRDWAKQLKVPFFSIDYSLAPEHRFPTAMLEVVSVYEYILKNPNLFGSTGKKIILTGESAGASLIMGAMFVCMERNIPLPHGLLLVNIPLQLEFKMSPSRLLSNLDPLLPFGFMLRCAAAYCGEPVPCDDSDSCIYCDDPNDPIHNEFEEDEKLRPFNIPDSHYYNCLKAPEHLLKQLPRIILCSTTADPVLDEMVMFGKRLRSLGNQVSLKVFQDLPHGFLNFSLVNGSASKASFECAQAIATLLHS